MYNRYIPQEMEDVPVFQPEGQTSQSEKPHFSLKKILSSGVNLPWKEGFQEGGDPLDSLLKSLKLEGVDSGDILLILLILFLLIEGDDQWELIITLGLLLIMGLAEGEK